jgi:hypothetical protein
MVQWLRDLAIPGAVGAAALLALSCGSSKVVQRHDAPQVAPRIAGSAIPMPALIGKFVTAESWAQLKPVHQTMLTNIAARPELLSGLSTCFADGTDNNTMAVFNQVMFGLEPRFNQTNRWGTTASSPSGATGTPTTLTYSFVPDGTPIDGFNGEPAAPSNLFAFMRGIYGANDATWQAHYHAIFARWGQLCGVTYVYEDNDDAVALGSSAGSLNVRGDLRMGGHFIDGNSGVLAYNFFPQNGDMVIDTGDNYYTNINSNSLRLRNILAHEHGHGMGQAHVCPIAQTKLMEPFISTAYDGPRHDDIRNAQQHYGDKFEPNNSAGAATNLGSLAAGSNTTVGTVPAPAIPLSSLCSLNVNGDQDFYKISVTGQRLLTVTVTPIGENYDDATQSCSGQSGSCCSGTFTDSRAVGNLDIQVLASNGTTVISAGTVSPAGTAEVLSNVSLPGAGDYYIRVYSASGVSEVQLYTLGLSVVETTLALALPDGAPTLLAPGEPTSFPVTITAGSQTVTSAAVYYRPETSGAFTTIPLVSNGGVNYTATLPAFSCGQSPQYYIRANGSGGAVVTSPANAPTALHSATIGEDTVVLNDAFETNQGWTVQNDAALTSGAWVRVDPNGTTAAPEDDHTAAGTQCYVTGQGTAGGQAGAADVDGGTTHLISPVFDATGASEVIISYWRWYSNNAGGAPAADTMVVAVSSNNGGAYTTVETVGPTTQNAGGWLFNEVRLSDFPAITRTSQMRLRFSASDLATGSLVEAAVDDVLIAIRGCESGCGTSDFNGDGDFGTDADIEAFFACLAGSCCPSCFPGGSDFDGDGDFGTDADIESFFRVLGGGAC